MGHSYVCHGDRCTLENDADLTVLRHFVEREGYALLNEWQRPPRLMDDFEQFLRGFVSFGPGVYQVDFAFLFKQSDWHQTFLLAVLDRVRTALEAFAPAIPLAYAAIHINPLGAVHFTGDVETGTVLESLQRIRNLFAL